MNLHQFRFVQEAVRRNLNLTETAKALFTSQPGISKAIIELEEELGIEIFERHGKRLRRITEPGQLVLQGRRADHARGGEPAAHRRGVLEAGRRHAVDRHHAHPGALLPAGAHGGAAPQVSQGAGGAAPGHATPGGANAARRRGRDRSGHRGAARRRRSGDAALLRVAARDRRARRNIRWPASSGPRWSNSPPSRWCRTTRPLPAALASIRPLHGPG